MNATRHTLRAPARKEAVQPPNSTLANLSGALRDLDKQIWILEAHAEKK